MAIYVTRFCMILKNMQDFAWFCKIHEKFEAFLPRIFSRNYQRLKQTLPILRYGVQKLNYQRSKLPISKVTNIEVYLSAPMWHDSGTFDHQTFELSLLNPDCWPPNFWTLIGQWIFAHCSIEPQTFDFKAKNEFLNSRQMITGLLNS